MPCRAGRRTESEGWGAGKREDEVRAEIEREVVTGSRCLSKVNLLTLACNSKVGLLFF